MTTRHSQDEFWTLTVDSAKESTRLYFDPLYRLWLSLTAHRQNQVVAAKRAARLTGTEVLQEGRHVPTRTRNLELLGPERLAFSKYLENPTFYSTEVTAHWLKHGHWIDAKMRELNNAWCVVCGNSIVKASRNPSEFPAEEDLFQIGRQYNLIPFAYGTTLLPEEVGMAEHGGTVWLPTVFRQDYYPRITVKIEEALVEDDFDTGAIQTLVSDDLVPRGILNFLRSSDATFLGSSYSFFTKRISVSIVASDGDEQRGDLVVSVVDRWNESAFTQINPKRQCLFGRDILRAFATEIILNSHQRITKIRLLT